MSTTPPPPNHPSTGLLRLTLQGNILMNMPPRVLLNGHHVATHSGTNDFHLAPGPYQVDVSVQWMRQYGQASARVDVRPGQVAELWYAAPWHQFTTGNIGPTKQPHKGLEVMVAVTVGSLLIGCCVAMSLIGIAAL